MRYRTAIILSFLLIGGMFGFRVVVDAAVNRCVEQGVVIPLYERVLLGVAVFWLHFQWLLIPAIAGALFLIAVLTGISRKKK